MKSEEIRLAVANWRVIHEVIHGALTKPELELVDEIATFLTDCARAEALFSNSHGE